MANSCKYYKQVLQVSYDSGVTWVNVGETRKGDLYEYNSPACGGVTQYRWVDVTGQYTCDGTTKYQKTKRQYSEDGGQTWQDVSPAEYGKGDVIEYQSEDCGYEPPSYSGEYLTFVAIDDGRFKFSGSTGNNVSNDYISYSMDEGSTWSTLASDTYSPTVYAGQKIMWKGNLTAPGIVGEGYLIGVGRFSSSDRFNIEGNIMSLLYGDNFQDKTTIPDNSCEFESLFHGCWVVSAENLVLPATTLAEYCYAYMFYGCSSLTTTPYVLPATTLADSCYECMFAGCTSLTSAPTLPATTMVDGCYCWMFSGCTSLTSAPSLPATTLAGNCYNAMFKGCSSLTTAPELPATTMVDSCYTDMFFGCTSLTTAPELPATTLAEHCYSRMFYGCSSLTTAPELPATTLDYTCYSHMFSHCTSLTTAPVLPATTLKIWCYHGMFIGCTSLNYIKCLATDISDYDCTQNWTYGVSSTGTFVKASSMNDWSTGVDGIPNNWTVQNA